MSIYIVSLKIREGSFIAGFSVTLQISQEGLAPELEIHSQLPPAPNIPQQYKLWQTSYLSMERSPRLEAKKIFISNYSRSENCDRYAKNLLTSINNWLDAESFRALKERFLSRLNPATEIRILIQTENTVIQCLPWHLINWFEPYTKTEIAISNSTYEKEAKTSDLIRDKIRILAIIGNSQGIDTARDYQLLKQLPDSSVTLLVEPSRKVITEQLWDVRGWDILFFAGHSKSDSDKQTGYIQLNQQDNLTTKELKYALKKAITRGLKIAVFNSCDGLGLARELSNLNIPQIIAMREPVPDKVAQEFLKYFLSAYSGGKSLYLAVKEARAKLQGLEDRYPYATWLPLIVQNPAEIPPTWQQLHKSQTDISSTYQNNRFQRTNHVAVTQPKISLVLAISAIATIVVFGLRYLGMLQVWELKTFDYLSQKMPLEAGDQRILIVGADERDISNSYYQYPIPDRILAKLIARLQQYQPAVIGIDIFRDYPVRDENTDGNFELKESWQQPNVVSICLGDNIQNSVAAPSGSPIDRVGFANIYDDLQVTSGRDDLVRRYLLSRGDNPLSQTSYCETDYSFAWQLVYRYFQSRNIPVKVTDNNWQFGSSVIPRLTNGSGGYQKFDDRGNQLLISYRRTPQLAQQVTFRDILEARETFDPKWVKNRIVLVGVTAKSVPDVHDTAIGEVRGLELHAHVVSQIVSAVEDNRPLIWWLPFWGDLLWIGFWSVSSGLIMVLKRSYLQRTLAITGLISMLCGVCWLILIRGGWLALIPSIVAISFTIAGIGIYESGLKITRLRRCSKQG